MKYAVVQTCGSQYQVQEGQFLNLEKLAGKKGDEIIFDKVLLSVDGDKVEIGTPVLQDKKVVGEIIEQFKDKKMYVYKYKSKSRYRRKMGHRQQKTKVKIKKIV